MAAATSIIAGAGLALGAGTTALGAIGAGKTKKELNNYKRQKLKNYSEDMAISTAGSDIMREESARTSASLVNSVRQGGSRSINENLGKIVSMNNRASQMAAMDIDRQYQDRNRMVAMENSRIQDMYERREEQDIAGLGQKLYADKQTTWNGISAMQSSLSYGAMSGMFDRAPRRSPIASANNVKAGDVQITTGPMPGFYAPADAYSSPDFAYQNTSNSLIG